MSRPIDLKIEIEKIKNIISNLQDDFPVDLSNLFSMVEASLPKIHVHGKKCPSCSHRMHCKTINCPMCHHVMKKRKRQECNECKPRHRGEYPGNSLPIQLKCGCRYCHHCKKTRVGCKNDSWRFRCKKSTVREPTYHILPCKVLKAMSSKIEDKTIFKLQNYMVTAPCELSSVVADCADCCAFAERYLNNEPTFADRNNVTNGVLEQLDF